MNKDVPEEVKKYFRERHKDSLKKATSARWAGHEKQSEEERKAKARERAKRHREKKKLERLRKGDL